VKNLPSFCLLVGYSGYSACGFLTFCSNSKR